MKIVIKLSPELLDGFNETQKVVFGRTSTTLALEVTPVQHGHRGYLTAEAVTPLVLRVSI